MTKRTTSLAEILASHLILKGFNEFYEVVNGKFTNITDNKIIHTFGREAHQSFVWQLILENNQATTESINYIFQTFKLENNDFDKQFKINFLARFYNYDIQQETIEMFLLKLKNFLFTKKDYLNYRYKYLDMMLSGKSSSSNTRKHRTASADTPRDIAQLDVSNDVLANMPNENTITNDYDVSENQAPNYEILNKILNDDAINKIYEEIRKKLFMNFYS